MLNQRGIDVVDLLAIRSLIKSLMTTLVKVLVDIIFEFSAIDLVGEPLLTSALKLL